jgi:hypothetical protein
VLPYESVIDIDEKGDDWFDGGKFRDYNPVKLATIVRWSPRQADPDPETRVDILPADAQRQHSRAALDAEGGDDPDRAVSGEGDPGCATAVSAPLSASTIVILAAVVSFAALLRMLMTPFSSELAAPAMWAGSLGLVPASLATDFCAGK